MLKINENSLFSLLVCAFSVVLLIQTMDMRSDAALVPQVVGVPLFILSCMQLLGDFVPAIARKLSFIGAQSKGMDRTKVDEGFSLKGNYLFIGWMVAFVLLMHLAGVVGSIAIALFAYLKFLAKQSWMLSITYSALFALSIYLIFVQGMDIHYFTSPGLWG